MAKPRKIKYVSPAGEAVYPYVNKADTADIAGKPQRPAFKTGLRLPEDSEAGTIQGGKAVPETLRQLIDRLVDEAWDEHDIPPKYKKVAEKAYPYDEEVDASGEPTGNLLFKFKQNESIKMPSGEIVKLKIALFDAKKQKVTANVGGGSRIKVAFTHRPYGMVSGKQYNVGISLDFSAVQVLELVEFGGGNADSFGFGEEDGYEGADAYQDNDDDSLPVDEVDGDDDF